MRVVDYIVNFLYEKGVEHIFMLTGGGAMFLNDAVACHPRMKAICNHHEQACAMAVVGYSKYRGYGSAIVTSGCGATNTLTGLLDAWQDNVPCMFFSGQVKRKETTRNSGLPLRTLGVQEADIIPIVTTITKYSTIVNDPSEIAYHLEKAYYLSKSGRPGPVWLDIPMDVQGAMVTDEQLKHYVPEEFNANPSLGDLTDIRDNLARAKRPIVLAGNGIKLAHAEAMFRKFISTYNLPVVTTFLAIDILPSNSRNYIGRIGIKGDRAGNFALQNSDFVLSIGCRLGIPHTGYEYNLFARSAKLYVVDIDPIEHQKNTVKIDKVIIADAGLFFKNILEYLDHCYSSDKWREKCVFWRDKWPVCLPEYVTEKPINMYHFVNQLSLHLRGNDVVVSDAGSAYYVVCQGLKLKNNQKFITSGSLADMGFTLPAAIGASIAKNGDVIGITGDGSLQLNIQELQTLKYHQIPVKLFVWNNNGYLSIRTTQKKFFQARYVGTDSDSGVSFPEISKIAEAYGLPYYYADSPEQLDKIIKQVLQKEGPVICEVMCSTSQEVKPTVSSFKNSDGSMISKPLEDMYPFLEREEFIEEMIVSPINE
jgi:acetolactate synthase I/II/III large subunit